VDVLFHIGHAGNEVEVALTIFGFVVTLIGLGVAVMALWPRKKPGVTAERVGHAPPCAHLDTALSMPNERGHAPSSSAGRRRTGRSD
jgi:hypothetical protein